MARKEPSLPSLQGSRVRACASLLAAPGLAGMFSQVQPWRCPVVHDPWSECLIYLFCFGTGRGKDTLAGGDEDSSARSAARPALAQCRALSVDCTGPGSPRRLYLSVQVRPGAFKHMRGPAECPTGSCEGGSTEGELGTCFVPLWAAKLLAAHPPVRHGWSNLLY